MTTGPLAAYRTALAEGRLRPDPWQELAAEKLQSLHHALLHYHQPRGPANWAERFGLKKRNVELPPQGLYIYGSVGRGKSMIMDLFFAESPVARKRRIHFHDFMLQVHGRIHHWRQHSHSEKTNDPIPPLAKHLAEEAWLLCFDEFQVHDIADAMMLGRLFEELFARGVVVVATSNRHPDDLYKNGLQRARFLPFIEIFKKRLDVLALDGDTDYRMDRMRGMPVFYSPLGPESRAQVDDYFTRLIDGQQPRPTSIPVAQNRSLRVPMAAGGVARFGFEELCARALGAADYLAVAVLYHTVVIDDVPHLSPDKRNEAKRFVTLIDALYEHKVKLVLGADAPPEALYPAGDGAFEFERTVSRLMEMQSEEYMAQPHLT